MPALLDKEISNVEDDAFGHRHYAKALRSLIEEYNPPYSIGLLGSWGVGKSSIKEMYLSELNNSLDKRRKQSIHTITFNAWRFGGLDIKKALLRHIFISLGGQEVDITNKLYSQVSENITKRRKGKDIIKEIIQNFIWYPAQFLVIVVIISSAVIFLKFVIDNWIATTILGSILVVSSIFIINNIKSFKAPLVPLYSTITNVHPVTTSAEQYIDYLLFQLKKFKKENKDVNRIVIFIDDLDRLTSEEMVSSLEAVRVFMDIPKEYVPDDLGVVFVLSCDEDKVEKALLKNSIGKEISKNEARRYLDRIFQFRLDIPPFPKRDMRSYALKKLKEAMPEFEDDLKIKNINIDEVIDRLIHVGVQSPRNALQLVNAYVQSLWIAKMREFDGTGSDRAGGLYEGTVTSYPVVLAIITSIKIEFPYFYNDMLEEPCILIDFSKVFIGKDKDGFSTSRSKAILSKYSMKEDICLIKDEYEDLRQYISSIQGIALPKTLQPFLLLSQDAISRSIGDNAKIYDSLVSGDIEGIFNGFNISSYNLSINTGQIKVLEDIVEDIFTDTTTRVENAAFVLGKLLINFERKSESIIRFIALKLTDSLTLRNRLSINTIKDITKECSREDKVRIANVLINDFIGYDDEIQFKNPQGETYSFEDMIEVINIAINIVLEVYSSEGLSEENEYKLINWLKERIVKASGLEDYISYKIFDKWYRKYEKKLVEQLGYEYIKEGLDFLTKESKFEYIEAFNHEYKKVVELLWDRGQESRELAYKLLNSSFVIKNENIIMNSIEEIMKIIKDLDQAKGNNIFNIYSEMLEQQLNEPILSENSLRIALSSFISLIDKFNDFSEEGLVAITNVNVDFAISNGFGQFSSDLLNLTFNKGLTSAQQILNSWLEHGLLTLEDECIEWLANNIVQLQENIQVKVLEGLEIIKNKNNELDDKVIGKIRLFIDIIVKNNYKLDSITKYFNNVVTDMYNNYSNKQYISEFFPLISEMLSCCDEEKVANLLQRIFYDGFTSYYNENIRLSLCRSMIGKWKAAKKGCNQLVNIYNNLIRHLQSKSHNEGDIIIFESLYTLVKANFDDEEKMHTLGDIFSLLWIIKPDECTRLVKKYDIHLSPANLGKLSEQVKSENQYKDLENIWSILSRDISCNDFLSVVEILLKSAKESVEDKKLHYWVHVNKKFIGELSRYVIEKESNEEQKKRVISQILLYIDALNYNELKEFIVKAIERVDDKLLEMILQAKEKVEGLIGEENRNDFNDAILKAACESENISIKTLIFQWIAKIKDPDFIRRNKDDIESDKNDDNKKLLKRYFPNEKLLEKL